MRAPRIDGPGSGALSTDLKHEATQSVSLPTTSTAPTVTKPRRALPRLGWPRLFGPRTIGVQKRPLGRLAAVLQFFIVAIGGGFGSAWYMIERGGELTTRRYGPWQTWINAGRAEIDPYTRAHLVRRSRIILDSYVATTFEAEIDDEGEPLLSACEYAVEGPSIDASWWRLAVFTQDGRLIDNRAERHAVNNHTALRQADGSYAIALSREARAGNWLPTGGGGHLMLILTVSEEGSGGRGSPVLRLPGIRRIACR